jgi:hypothetical protein
VSECPLHLATLAQPRNSGEWEASGPKGGPGFFMVKMKGIKAKKIIASSRKMSESEHRVHPKKKCPLLTKLEMPGL